VRRTLTLLTASVLLPVILPATTTAVAAVADTLTLTVLDRSGAAADTMAAAVNLTSKKSYELKAGARRALPAGTYALTVSIYTPSDNSQTLGARVVTVKGNAATTIDARLGAPLTVSLTPAPPAEYRQLVQASICTDGSPDSSAYGSVVATPLYVIPEASPRFRLAYSSSWTDERTPTPRDAYMVSGQSVAVPGRPDFTFARSTLATLAVRARRGPAGALRSRLWVRPDQGGCRDGHGDTFGSVDAPGALTAYMSPGRWNVRAEESTERFAFGAWSKTITLAAGRRHSQDFFTAAWGPAGLPFVAYGDLRFSVDKMFRDPGFGGAFDHEDGQRVALTLVRGKKTVFKKTVTDRSEAPQVQYFLRGEAAWYTLTASAKRQLSGVRYPAGMLSPAATAKFRFRADPGKSVMAPLYVPRFLPAGLDLSNQARGGSTTTVALRLDRLREEGAKLGTAKVKTVTLKASFDGGKTWKPVAVRHNAKSWAATVRNPASGAVSLRATVTDGKGNSCEVTVLRAYAVR
jgi:hypothetical protein